MADRRKALLEKAIRHLEKAVSLAGDNARYQAALGKALLLAGHPERARGPLLASFQAGAPPQVAYLLGVVSVQLRAHEDAESYATTAIKQSPGFGRAHTLRSVPREARGDREGALYDLRIAHSLGMAPLEARLHLAALLLEEAPGMMPGPGTLTEVADAIRSDSFGEHEELRDCLNAWRLFASGRAGEALDVFQRVAVLPAAEAAFWQAACLVQVGRGSEAEALLDRVGDDPRLAPAAASLRSEGLHPGIWPASLRLDLLPEIKLLRGVEEGEDESYPRTIAEPQAGADLSGEATRLTPSGMTPATRVVPESPIPHTVLEGEVRAPAASEEGTKLSPTIEPTPPTLPHADVASEPVPGTSLMGSEEPGTRLMPDPIPATRAPEAEPPATRLFGEGTDGTEGTKLMGGDGGDEGTRLMPDAPKPPPPPPSGVDDDDEFPDTPVAFQASPEIVPPSEAQTLPPPPPIPATLDGAEATAPPEPPADGTMLMPPEPPADGTMLMPPGTGDWTIPMEGEEPRPSNRGEGEA